MIGLLFGTALREGFPGSLASIQPSAITWHADGVHKGPDESYEPYECPESLHQLVQQFFALP